MTKLVDHFNWRAESDMPGDVDLDIFQEEDDITALNWDLGVWWNHGMASAAFGARLENVVAVDLLPRWMQDLVKNADKEVAESFVKDAVNRIPRTEQRIVDHMEAMLSHILRAKADVSKTPFMVYDATTGIWRTEGEWINEKQIGTSVGSLIDGVIGNYMAAMNRAVDAAYEMIDEVHPSPGPRPIGPGSQALLPAWQAAKDRRDTLANKVKKVGEVIDKVNDGKIRQIKSSLQTRLAVQQTYWDGEESLRWLVLSDGVLDLEDVYAMGRMDVLPFSPWHASTMALNVSWNEASAIRDLEQTEWVKGISKTIPDVEVRTYLQKRYGAALLGRPGEAGKSMVWQYGVGDTGKSTLQEAIAGARGVFKPYSYQADAEVLTQKGAERGATDRFSAYVRGKRYAIISELDAGAQLNQGKFKTMTGGETVSGTAKYSNEVTYFFTATLFVSSNHPPSLPYGDTALSNRIHVVPFENRLIVRSKVSAEEWDATPVEKRADEAWLHKLLGSQTERAAILRWVLEGLVDFGGEGIGNLPAAMQAARKDFVDEGDPVARIVNSLLGKDDDSNHVQRLRIYTEGEWQTAGWDNNLGCPLARMDELIVERARALGYTNEFGDVSKKQIGAAKKMIHELGGERRKVFYGRRDDGRTVTGVAFARAREIAVDSVSDGQLTDAPGYEF